MEVVNRSEDKDAPELPERRGIGAGAGIDWCDVRMGLLVGAVFAVLKVLDVHMPAWRVDDACAILPCALCVAYIFRRARREPGKLDAWGLTTPITRTSVAWALALFAAGLVLIGAVGRSVGSTLAVQPAHVFKMISYLASAFPQQFFLCSVVLVSLEKLPPFRGTWRLVLATAVLFGLAHIWSPVLYVPGTWIPIVLITTAPIACLGIYYFLRFRNVLPLVAAHAIYFVLLGNWIERLIK